MGFYEDQILPRGIDWGMSGERFSKLRQQYLKDVAGKALEVGFGSGLNLPHYTSQVTHLYALDPSQLGRRLAKKRIQRAPFRVEFVELEDSRIALPDHSVDTVVSTWTVCTIPDPCAALKEIHRVLRPGGGILFSRTWTQSGSPSRSIAKLVESYTEMVCRGVPCEPRNRSFDFGIRFQNTGFQKLLYGGAEDLGLYVRRYCVPSIKPAVTPSL